MAVLTTDKVRLATYIEPALKARLERVAKAERRSVSNLVEIICERFCDEFEAQRNMEPNASTTNSPPRSSKTEPNLF